MKFTYSEWEGFCRALSKRGIYSTAACSVLESYRSNTSISIRFLNLKHDVESHPEKALELAKLESKYGHHSTYYIQGALMTEANVRIFKEIQGLGHEVSIHHEVMDLARGDLLSAIDIFESEIKRFESFGFKIITVCQHGNPVSEYENRDFFKSQLVQKKFHNIVDIMVNYGREIAQDYVYISDAGMSFNVILDPMSPYSKSKLVGNSDDVLNFLLKNPDRSFIVSAHPHRYNRYSYIATIHKIVFDVVRIIARPLLRVPTIKKFIFNHSSITKYI